MLAQTLSEGQDNAVSASVEDATSSVVNAAVGVSFTTESAGEGQAQAQAQAASIGSSSASIRSNAKFPASSAYGMAEAGLTPGELASRTALLSRYSQSYLSAKSMQHASHLELGTQSVGSGYARKLSLGERGVDSYQATTLNTQSLSTLQATYSYGFPDSTRGTALISPPDLGTSSPLDWSPQLNFAFKDFESHNFLVPTLQVSAKRKGKRSRRKSLQEMRSRTSVQPALTSPSIIGPVLSKPLQPDILNQPLPKSPLQSPLDQPLDSQQ